MMTDQNEMTLFRQFVKASGFNLKQIALAAEKLGMKAHTAFHYSRGIREPDEVARLAMSAYRAGLAPWTPEIDAQLDRIARRVRKNGGPAVNEKRWEETTSAPETPEP